MSNVIAGSSSGPGGSSVSGVGTGSRSSSGSSPISSGSNSRSDSMSGNVIYATNAHSDNAPYFYGSNSKNGSMLDYINSYNQYNIDNANDRYDYRYQNMLEYNNANYQKGLDWSEYMSNTAIQRQVKDLIAAGLNPILAAKLGGASYSMPSIPYVSNVANPVYNTFDSQAYNSELDYQATQDQISMQGKIAVLNSITNMSIAQLQESNKKFMNWLDNTVSMYNNEQRIQAEKEMQKLEHEFKELENVKDRGSKIDLAVVNGIFRILSTVALVGAGVATANPVLVYAGVVTGVSSLGGFIADSTPALTGSNIPLLPGA